MIVLLGKRPSVQNCYDTYKLCIVSNWRKPLYKDRSLITTRHIAFRLYSERNAFCVLILWRGSLTRKSKYDNWQSWFLKVLLFIIQIKMNTKSDFLKWDRFELNWICYNRIFKNLIQHYERHGLLLLELFNSKMFFFFFVMTVGVRIILIYTIFSETWSYNIKPFNGQQWLF